MKNSKRESISIKRVDVLIEILLIVLAAIMFIPIYYMFVSTLKTPEQATLHPLALPSQFYFDGYVSAWKSMNYPRVFLNNIIINTISVLSIILLGSLAAYTFARRKNKLNSILFFIFLTSLIIPLQMGLVSLYRVIKILGLMNQLPSVILVDIAGNLTIAIFLFRGFIRTTVPIQLEESAFIDGCGMFNTYWKIVFPLLKPVIATIAILDSLNIWNDFMNPLLFLHSREKGVILQEIFRNIGMFQVNWIKLFPMLVLGVLPLMVFYIFMQKYIIKGVAAGAIKG